MQILFLMIWLLAQSSETGAEGGGVPLELMLLGGLVIAGIFIRLVFRTGSQHRRRRAEDDDDPDDDDDEEEESLHRHHRYHEAEDEELYLMDRDHAWDEDGYSIEDEF